MMDRLRALRHPLLAEVRGTGLFFGAEFVLDDRMAPATAFVAEVVERMVARGFLMNRIGRAGNTLKIRPPMPFSIENADQLADALEQVLAETPVAA
jgi:4-aminobutyrate aminotransferase-like enzyme